MSSSPKFAKLEIFFISLCIVSRNLMISRPYLRLVFKNTRNHDDYQLDRVEERAPFFWPLCNATKNRWRSLDEILFGKWTGWNRPLKTRRVGPLFITWRTTLMASVTSRISGCQRADFFCSQSSGKRIANCVCPLDAIGFDMITFRWFFSDFGRFCVYFWCCCFCCCVFDFPCISLSLPGRRPSCR